LKLLKQYILKTYSQTFFPIFFTLYTITSIIFLVRIATLTSVIQIDFLELLELYLYSMPKIIFYTLPISVFVALCLAVAKLSSEYELIVITSFGFDPIKVIKIILPNLIITTIILLLLSLALMPKADFMRQSFIKDKKTEAQFNIKPSEYGQEFGNWLIYVNDEDDGLYKDVVLFLRDGNEDNFIIAKTATVENKDLSLSLKLQKGRAVKVSNSVTQIDFEKMNLNNEIKKVANINSFDDLLVYWEEVGENKRTTALFVFYVLLSIFPLVSILFVLYVGYFNPRYDKNNTIGFALLLIVIFSLATDNISKTHGLLTLYLLPIVWFFISYIVYKLKVKPYY
jgi:lipopolysaccharide export system permease protein